MGDMVSLLKAVTDVKIESAIADLVTDTAEKMKSVKFDDDVLMALALEVNARRLSGVGAPVHR